MSAKEEGVLMDGSDLDAREGAGVANLKAGWTDSLNSVVLSCLLAFAFVVFLVGFTANNYNCLTTTTTTFTFTLTPAFYKPSLQHRNLLITKPISSDFRGGVVNNQRSVERVNFGDQISLSSTLKVNTFQLLNSKCFMFVRTKKNVL